MKKLAFPFHPTIIVILLLMQLQLSLSGTCSYNSNCYYKCYLSQCQYDPLTNSFYNSSITDTSSGYHGPGCCGCMWPYFYDHIYDAVTKSCVQGSCPLESNQTFWVNQGSGFCNISCPSYAPYKNYDTGRCQYNCSNGYFRYTINYTYHCNKTCPSGWYGVNAYLGILQCNIGCHNLQFKNNFTRLCEQKCSGNYFGHPLTKYCLQECPYLDFKHYPTKICVQDCPDGYYKSIKTRSCVSNCYNQSLGQFYNNQTGKCDSTCPYGMSGDKNTGFCLSSNGQCPSGLFKLDSAHKCVTNCAVFAPSSSTSDAIFSDFLSKRCVNSIGCPFDHEKNLQMYAQNSTMSCVYFCDPGEFRHPQQKACTRSCYGLYPVEDYNSYTFSNWSCLPLKNTQNINNIYIVSNNTLDSHDHDNYVSKTTLIIYGVVSIVGLLLVIVGIFAFYHRWYRPNTIPELNQSELNIVVQNNPTFIESI